MPGDPRLTILQSVNSADGLRCVDILHDLGGTFTFVEYRRDFEDTAGWYPVGNHTKAGFETLELAWSAAQQQVAWLNEPKSAQS